MAFTLSKRGPAMRSEKLVRSGLGLDLGHEEFTVLGWSHWSLVWGSQRCAGLEEGKDDSIQIEVGQCWGPGACWDCHYWTSRLGGSRATMPCRVWEARGLELGGRREGTGRGKSGFSSSLHVSSLTLEKGQCPRDDGKSRKGVGDGEE